MKSHYRVVVIGGGIVGTSVLYHLAKFGWTDVALIERAELTCGSTWHAAGGFHALNDDPNIAALQSYTIRLYDEIERESGVSVGMHMTGGISSGSVAGTHGNAQGRALDIRDDGNRNASRDARRNPRAVPDRRCDESAGGGLYDEHEGYMDPHGTTHAVRRRGGRKSTAPKSSCAIA